MIDSRERNSADGSLVQKARRQVEIFQSQGTSGRSFQVVRASQWSSSRATDIAFDVPMTKPSNTQFSNEPLNGTTIPTPAPRLSLWRTSLDNGTSDLDRLSCLCRKLHDEAMNTTNLWSSLRTRSPSPLSSLENTTTIPRFQEIEAANLDAISDRLSTSSLGERRSNSTEDISSLLNVDETFARDCKTRRSLQVHNSENKGNGQDAERTKRRNEFIAERAKRFEEGARESENDTGMKKNFISTKSFTSIADNDFVKNDPNHKSKFSQQFSKISIQDGAQNGHTIHRHVSSPVLQRTPRFDSPPAPAPRKANNKTVVHLRNAASPTSETEPPPRCINVTAIKLENDVKESSSHTEPTNDNGTYGMLMDTSTKEDTTTMAMANGGTKPVKKVEFCKTEIHFAADSGKVNIVETDGKPPPTNKFRRRRRNSSIGVVASNNVQKSNMPLVHFGDTSYEKYIFGGQGKLFQDGKKTGLLNDNLAVEDINNTSETDVKKERWDTVDKVRDDGANKDSYVETSLEKVGEHGAGKYRGTHTTTVNLMSDECSSVVPKVTEDKSNTFTATNHISTIQRAIEPVSEKLPNKSQVLSKDPDSNQVLLKIVTTHKPMLARVENDHTPTTLPMSRSVDTRDESPPIENKIDKGINIEAKDHCDNSKGTIDEIPEAPTYENIFDAVSDGIPVYENFQIVQAKPIVVKEKKVIKEKIPVKKRSPSVHHAERTATSNDSYDRKHKKVSTKLSNGPSVTADKTDKVTSSRSITPMSTLSKNSSSHSAENGEPKRTNRVSNRSSSSRDNSIKRYKDTKQIKEDGTRSNETRRRSSSKIDPTVKDHKSTLSSVNSEKNGGTLRSKKPVEVVYQTAVFNMKNEKLSKPAKAKEVKGPRLINDLICGSKMRRPSDNKKIIKTAIVSQNTSKRKETPTTINR